MVSGTKTYVEFVGIWYILAERILKSILASQGIFMG
jgi:hypothetical protein